MATTFDPIQLVPLTELTNSFVSYRLVTETNGVLIRQIIANNRDSGIQSFDITLDGATGAEAKRLYRNVEVQPGETLVLPVHDVVVNGENIGIKASNNSVINIMISGIKLSS